ncbi:MAG: alpha/beta fold hydrolase [Phenylobacterium sp.]|uniref:alpha/beta fold hydrolase n=1 Tax=Phenylobacterium sp. TaxID=1871053 RepID=UPI00391B4688
MDRPKDDNVSLVIETMYRVAADPEAWEQLIDALAEGGMEPPPGAASRLARSEEIARLASRPDEGPSPGAGRADLGWVVFGAGRRVVAASPAASAILADGLGRLEIGRDLILDDAGNAEALRRALERVRADDRGQAILKLEREAEEGPRFAYVVPARVLPGLTGALPPDEGALALIFPAAEEAGRLWSSIRESFGLTAAEVRLARKLRDGRSLKEAADELEVSINTVRNQLRAVFEKMGLKRQSDLVRALAELSSVAGALDAAGAGAPPVQHVILPDGRRLAYRDYGTPAGRPVLWFHEGLGSSLLPPEAPALARSLGLRIVAAERPGFGQSDAHPGYGFEAVAEDMTILCDRLGLSEVRLAAVLSGAPSALHTAAKLGARARALHLYSGRAPRPTSAGFRNPLTLFRERIENNPWVVETFFGVLRLRLSPGLAARLVRRSIAHAPADQAFVAERPEVTDFIAASAAEALARSVRGPADEIRAFRRADGSHPPHLSAPVVVWHGEEDVFSPLPQLQAYLGALPYELRLLPGVGHLLAFRRMEETMRALAA